MGKAPQDPRSADDSLRALPTLLPLLTEAAMRNFNRIGWGILVVLGFRLLVLVLSMGATALGVLGPGACDSDTQDCGGNGPSFFSVFFVTGMVGMGFPVPVTAVLLAP